MKRAKKDGPGSIDVSGRMDIRVVAQRAKVSISTVSRTMNRVSTVNPKMAKRVHEAIESMGYFPNTQARALVSGRSRLLGLIVSRITHPLCPELIRGFEAEAVEHGYEIMVCSTNDDPRRLSLSIRRMLERRVEGVAVMTFSHHGTQLQELAERKVPLVAIDAGWETPGISLLRVDYRQGIEQGVRHLAALGHRDIAFITGPKELHAAQSCRAAFDAALDDCRIESNPAWIVEGNHTMHSGREAMDRLLNTTHLPTAVMCSNDLMAIGVLHTLYRAGLKLPGFMSVIGFDDIHLAQVSTPPLTTIQLSRMDLARSAVTALRVCVEKGVPPQGNGTIHTHLVVRESTSFPRRRSPSHWNVSEQADHCSPIATV